MTRRRRPRASGRSSKQPAETAPEFFDDFVDLVAELNRERARFLLVGAYAMAAHGIPRATGDLDVWVDPGGDNAERVHRALVRFGAPLAAMGVTAADLAVPGRVVQIGLPPRRIDVMTAIDGVAFGTAWAGRLRARLGAQRADYIGRAALLRNKRAMSRAKDLADVELLQARTTSRRRRATR